MSISPKSRTTQLASQAYDLWSMSYDQLQNPMLVMVDVALSQTPLSVAGQNVIEFGCGTGRNIPKLRAAGIESYLGIELSSGMLAKAAANFPNETFLMADLTGSLPVENASADYILCTLVCEHIELLVPTLREAHRLLRPLGTIRILEIHSDISSRGTQAHFHHDGTEISPPNFVHDESQWKTALSAVGFSEITVRHVTATDEALLLCPKLAKHRDRSILIDITAKKNGSL